MPASIARAGLYNFYPRSPCGERLVSYQRQWISRQISIHALLAESDIVAGYAGIHARAISIHALLAESDISSMPWHSGATISIHALLAESDAVYPRTRRQGAISIHALLAESDCRSMSTDGFARISIHALLAESDVNFAARKNIATADFYPRSPCGERRIQPQRAVLVPPISIHALLAESDRRSRHQVHLSALFLSTLSLRRATDKIKAQYKIKRISIHALLAESDSRFCSSE